MGSLLDALPIERLASLGHALTVTGIVLAFLTGFASLGAHYVGRELDKRREARFAPREVSAEQRKILLATLSGTTGTLHLIYPADEEAQMFAEQVKAVISESGWQVTTVGSMSFGPTFGFTLEVRDDAERPNLTVLQHALERAFPSEPVVRRVQPSLGGQDQVANLSVGLKRRISPETQ